MESGQTKIRDQWASAQSAFQKKKKIAKDLEWDAEECQRPSENLQRIKKLKVLHHVSPVNPVYWNCFQANLLWGESVHVSAVILLQSAMSDSGQENGQHRPQPLEGRKIRHQPTVVRHHALNVQENDDFLKWPSYSRCVRWFPIFISSFLRDFNTHQILTRDLYFSEAACLYFCRWNKNAKRY